MLYRKANNWWDSDSNFQEETGDNLVSEHIMKHSILRKESNHDILGNANMCYDESHDDMSAEGYNHFSQKNLI